MSMKLILRNIRLYFRDKTAVFFSLLAVLIVIVLYILFLSKLQIDSVNAQTNNMLEEDILSYLINSWILAGLLSITVVTSTLGGLGTMVSDRENRIVMDFKSSPLSIMSYPIASVVTAFLIGTMISLISLVFYGGYIYLDTGYLIPAVAMIKCVGLILLTTLMNSALMGFLVSFLHTLSGFSSASLIIGTTIGFVNGVYVPMGSLPEIIQTILKYLPFSHIGSLFRRILMEEAIELSFQNVSEEVKLGYMDGFGVTLSVHNYEITPLVSISIITLLFIVSLVLFFINFRRKGKEI